MFLEINAICIMLLHLYICPFTKVEESFNIQAIHDVIHHGIDIEKYDHLEFPGVVPRSFLGPLVVGVVSKPFVIASNLLGFDKFCEQYIVRGILGLASMFSFFMFCKGVETRFGSDVKHFLLLITMTQFHFVFYSSRPLPNVFALSLVMLALSSWLHQRHKSFIWLAGAAIIIFRFDLVMLFGLILLHDLCCQRLRFVTFVMTTLVAGVTLLGLTTVVDSYFWQRWLWPEGEVMWFNVVLNKSHEYGTLPFLWYFYSAIPRSLLSSLLLIPIGVFYNRPVVTLLWPAIGYIFLFSFLPHKELRFIIYTFPVFNTAAACALAYLWKGQGKSFFRKIFFLGALGTVLVNVLATTIFLYISNSNYPGGVAMQTLNNLEKGRGVHVHVDVFTAQTGVTRFTQIHSHWIYNKTEELHPLGPDMMSYSHLLIGGPDKMEEKVAMYSDTHELMGSVLAFDRIKLQLKSFPPIEISLKEKCFLLKKRKRTGNEADEREKESIDNETDDLYSAFDDVMVV